MRQRAWEYAEEAGHREIDSAVLIEIGGGDAEGQAAAGKRGEHREYTSAHAQNAHRVGVVIRHGEIDRPVAVEMSGNDALGIGSRRDGRSEGKAAEAVVQQMLTSFDT